MNLNFAVSIYGNLTQYNEVLSKARCRIFYKYGNRNGTYITDDFADKLIASLPYTPIKGIYNAEEEDYESHGPTRDAGRIYGIVPENYNFAWEKHLDEDGVEREYACCDVLLFTALYKEAKEIVGKSQSMEIYGPSVKAHYQIIDGQKYYVFEEGCFVGLQILGDKTKPCFQGATFYSLYQDLQKLFSILEGGKPMEEFQLSHQDIEKKLFELLNPEYNEEGGYKIAFKIGEIYDSYAIVYDCEKEIYLRVYYTKDDANNSVTIDSTEECFIVDVTEDEYKSLMTIKAINNNNFEKIDTKFSELKEQISNYEIKTVELEKQIVTLTIERDSNYEQSQTLLKEIEALKNFKYSVERAEKEKILSNYGLLDQDILDKYKENLDQYSALELDKELTYELKKSNPKVFESQISNTNYILKDTPKNGIEEILSKYEKRMEE